MSKRFRHFASFCRRPCHPTAPCNFAPSGIWRGHDHRRRWESGPSSCGPSTAGRRIRRCGRTDSSRLPAWWPGLRYRMLARPYWPAFAIAARSESRFGRRGCPCIPPGGGSGDCCGTASKHVRRPTRHTAHRENRREEVDRDAQRIIRRCRIEIDIRI